MNKLKQLNAEANEIFKEYEKLCKEAPVLVRIDNEDFLYQELGEDLSERIKEIKEKQEKDRKELEEAIDRNSEKMEKVIRKVEKIVYKKLEELKIFAFEGMDLFGLLEPYAPSLYYIHPELHPNFVCMVTIADWERVEMLFSFINKWYA